MLIRSVAASIWIYLQLIRTLISGSTRNISTTIIFRKDIWK